LIEHFTDPGQPGEKYHPILEDLLNKQIIKSNTAEFGVQMIVNSFYKCVNTFPSAKIIFRTFGLDGSKIYNEFNLFLSGKLDTYSINH